MLFGLLSLGTEIRDDTRCGDYNTGQWDCLGKDELRFIVRLSLV